MQRRTWYFSANEIMSAEGGTPARIYLAKMYANSNNLLKDQTKPGTGFGPLFTSLSCNAFVKLRHYVLQL